MARQRLTLGRIYVSVPYFQCRLYPIDDLAANVLSTPLEP